jgi:hypothetical protein
MALASLLAARTAIAHPLGMPVEAPYKFGLGFAKGFVEDNNLTAIELCYQQDSSSFKYVEKAFANFVAGYDELAIEDLAMFAASLPTDLADCEAAKIDVVAIEDWATIFQNKAILMATITKNYALKRRKINDDRDLMKADWNAGEFYQSGFVAADLVKLAVGPVVVPAAAEVSNSRQDLPDPVGMPIKAQYEFASGFAFGFTEVNNLTAFELCYNEDASSFVYVKQAMAEFMQGNVPAAMADLALFGAALPADVAVCEAAKIDLTAVEAWATIFSNKPALIADVTKRYLLHKRAIDNDRDQLKADWALGEYYQAGIIGANLAYLAVGPVIVPTTSDLEPIMVSSFGI